MVKKIKELKVEKGMWLALLPTRLKLAALEPVRTEIEDVFKGGSPFFFNKFIIDKSNLCVCADCCTIFSKDKIKKWHKEHNGTSTAFCPNCKVDMAVGDILLMDKVNDIEWCKKKGLIKKLPEFNYRTALDFIHFIEYHAEDYRPNESQWERFDGFGASTGDASKLVMLFMITPVDKKTGELSEEEEDREVIVPEDIFDRYMLETPKERKERFTMK